jgi:EAL domain-containing protein (putative c-di-GMP-specific phosphodiesterase class I)
MRDVDEWVMINILQKISDNPKLPCLFINLSANSITDKEFCAFAESELKRHCIQQNQLCFEITETSAIKNIQQARAFMSALKDYNCQFALDDFGSGMSSFTYLKNLPVDYLKIEGSIVSDMINDQIDHAMVAAINQIGRVMKIKTIAEHVESTATLEQLKTIGVDYAQGYHIDEPFPIEDISTIIASKTPKMRVV